MQLTSPATGSDDDQLGANEDTVTAVIADALQRSAGVRVDPNIDGTVFATSDDPDIPPGWLYWGGRNSIPIQYRRAVTTI